MATLASHSFRSALLSMIKHFLFLVFFILYCPLLWAAQRTTPAAIQVGLLLDIKSETTDNFVTNMEQEIKTLLGNQYSISLPKNKRKVADWSKEHVLANYQALVDDPKVDIIVAAGALNAAVLARQTTFPKAVILVGILDYELQRIPLTAEKKSGVHNLTYVLESGQFVADLEEFQEIFPYRNLVIVADKKLIEILPDAEQFLITHIKNRGSRAQLITYDADLDALLEKFPADTDAVFLGGLHALDDGEKRKLIDHINQLHLPSFSFQGIIDVKRGALAGSALETNWQKVARRIALNIEQILDGADPAELATLFSFERRLSLNMQTAHQIDFSPSWATLAKADQIAIELSSGDHILGFKQVIDQALQANLTLAIEQLTVASAKEDVAQARAGFFPSISAGARATRVDEDSAGAFQAEDTYIGSLTVDQLLYSEGTLAGLTVEKHLLMSAKERYRKVRYDTILTAGLNYLDILLAQSAVQIRRNNLKLVQKNHDVAEYRQRVGYAGIADVLRLKSEMATVTSDLLAAESVLKQSKIKLNEFLHRPLQQEFRVEDVSLADDILHRTGGDEIQAAVNSPKALERLTLFLIDEAMAQVPELKQIQQGLAAQERILLSQSRRRWLPTLNLRGNVDQVVGRGGEGADALPEDETNWNLNLSANWELFSGGSISSEARQALAERNKLRQQLLDARQSIELALRNALLNLRVKSANLDLTQSAASAAKDNYQLVQDAYAQGTATITALLDAQNSSLRVEQSAVNSVYEYYASLLQMERAMGSFAIMSSEAKQSDFLRRFKSYMAGTSNR